MSREIRRVPEGWEHPRDYAGKFKPLFDDYANDWDEWLEEYERSGMSLREFCEDDRLPPNPEHYIDAWWNDADLVAWQIYETVSEGTPISPVFSSLAEMRNWLISVPMGGIYKQPLSPAAADQFIERRYAPSMMYTPQTGLVPGAEFVDS